MNINDYKSVLENIVNTTLYTSPKISSKLSKKLKGLKDYIKNSKTAIDDIRILLSTKNNENYFAYDEYLKEFFELLSLNDKIELLNNQSKYSDILRNEDLYISLWNTLKLTSKIKYLIDKKKYTNIDIALINYSVKESSYFTNNNILKEILTNPDIHGKIDSFSIELNYSINLLSLINLNDFEMCNILTKESYTTLLLKKCKTFDDFLMLYEDNNKIYNLICNEGLIFDNNDNQRIYTFINDNPNFIGKFNNKYLDLFNIVEIEKFSKIPSLDGDAYSSLIQKLYKYNNKEANDLFAESSLIKCSDHSISLYPFDDLNDETKKTIFNVYTLFNKFLDTIMIEAINNNFNEEDIVNILRNDIFVSDTSSYAIELLLNKLSFKSAFNMLQRKSIFDKISNLNVKVTDRDSVFVKGFLESPVLIVKSDHNMIFEMLSLLNKDDVLYYLALPYIVDNLSNYEIINLCINKKIEIDNIINSSVLNNKLNITDYISYLDYFFEKDLDLNIFKNTSLSSKLFNLSVDELKEINFDEVNYLFETIRTKSFLSKQTSKITINSYKSVLIAYLVFGLNDTLSFVSNGNNCIRLDDVKTLENEIIDERLLLFRENNSSIFQNMGKKILYHLNELDPGMEVQEFSCKLKRNTYIDNVIYLMLENNYDSYNEIINKLYSYYRYHSYDLFAAKKEVYDYCNKFIDLYIDNKRIEFTNDFENVILNNFKPKENIIYTERKRIGKEFISKLKFRLFVRALSDPNKELYTSYFKDDYRLDNIKNKYIEYLGEEVDFDSILEHVLVPICNDRFDKINCLNKLGIVKPENTDTYLKYLEDLKIIGTLNNKVKQLKKKYDDDKIISIMNYLCYGDELPFKLLLKEKNQLDKLAQKIATLSGEIYVDKYSLKFIYKDTMDIYNIEDIIEYNNYLKILENIIKKTTTYVNDTLDEDKVKQAFSRDYFKAMDTSDSIFPISSYYYEPKKRVFSLRDIEKIFSGYDITKHKKLTTDLKHFLYKNKNIIMIADGYYDDIVNNFGYIMSSWTKIKRYITELDKTINDVSLIGIENIITLLDFENDMVGKELDKDVIKGISESGFYEVLDLKTRINMLIDLYKDSFKKISSTVPYLSMVYDNFKIFIADSYRHDTLKVMNNSLFRIGAIGNDFFHYSVLNKNGLQIIIYKDDVLVSKILGVRNGNTIYLNCLEGEKYDIYPELLKSFARELINLTKDSKEPIEFVTMVNNDYFSFDNGYQIDSTLCPVINNPINTMYVDYDEFINNDNLLNKDEVLYTNYADNVSTLLASSQVVDKDNFKYYDADNEYLRKRRNVLKLSNNIGEAYLNRIDTILSLCKKEDKDIKIDDISLSTIDTIYLADDFVLFVTDRKKIIKFVLPYDDRAQDEVELIIKSITEELDI